MLRRRGRRLAAARLVGRPRRRHPDRALLLALQPRHDRPGLSSPAYDYLYRLESAGYPSLGYHPDWAIEDPRYLPQNLGHRAASARRTSCPIGLPGRARRPTDRRSAPSPARHARPVRRRVPAGRPARHRDERAPDQPGVPPRAPGPAALRAQPARHGRGPRGRRSSRCVNLMHFSQGWVQFGYRFSNDVAPFALRPRRARLRAAGASATDGACSLAHDPRRRVARDQPVGRALEPVARMVSRPRLAASLPVAAVIAVRGRPRWRCCPASRSGTPAELQAVAPAAGHRPPDRLPDLRAARLAGVGRAPAVRRAGLPDEPVRRRSAWRSRPGVTVDLVRPLTGRSVLGIAAGIGLALTPTAWAIGDARRDAHAPPRVRRDPALAARRAGTIASAGVPGRQRRPRRPLPGRGGRRLRAGRSATTR